MNHEIRKGVRIEHLLNKKKKLTLVLLLIVFLVTALLISVADYLPKEFIYNETSSMPIGWYKIIAYNPNENQLKKGDIVVFNLPQGISNMIYKRGYLENKNEKLLKYITGVYGDGFCVDSDKLIINNKKYVIEKYDTHGRLLPKMQTGKYVIKKGNIMTLTDVNNSFDSRYFGEVPITAIKYKVVPFIVWEE